MEVTTRAVRVHEPTDVAEARRVAVRLAQRADFDEDAAGRVALVTTELATNLLKHATGGEVLARAVDGGERPGRAVEIVALDHGPGMRDVETCLADGFSTAGSHGNGLGAVRRASAEFDVYSVGGQGTAVVSRVARQAGVAEGSRAFRFGAVSVRYPGEVECGDTWGIATTRAGSVAVLVADGLGHGTAASEAANRARGVFLEHRDRGPAGVIERVHDGLRSTRGAAVAVTEIDPTGAVRHCGLGNIAAMVIHEGRVQQMVSLNGTAGHEARRIREFEYRWPDGAVLVVHSDGLHTRWRLESYRGLEYRDPALLAAVLYRDARRGRDDVTVCALGEVRSPRLDDGAALAAG
jgi:anti-sigma regulatory factor (Ser/Thr protein kinase)